MEHLWPILDSIYKFLLAPLGLFFWWLFKKYDRRIEVIEERMNRIEKETMVLDTKLDNLKEGIDDIKLQLRLLFDILEKRR